ncbi:transcriptional regulator [Cytobacillus sp. FSL W7-1323]|uniref:LexA family protein n=1 Tax=Cytobacillus sp. FSL W7-1323 TaxID=2921700 RepID=UPI003158BC71
MHNKLTKRQREALDAVIYYLEVNNYQPSFRELGAILGLASSSTISGYLNKLNEKGYVSWEEGQSITLRIQHFLF